ncbi:two-component regulator propeller domain-containing protein [Dyadobacter jejuensis]|uniref:two-component regulator propeller domain-containing protein n=1 Tax=Dyadobacter jejuensis TaxID=1082580 RepID=UPI0011B248F2|nr:two-component regulator propeller domain-containing protein [Dyadobacter jejuensis]
MQLILFIGVPTASIQAQAPHPADLEYHIQHYTDENGLPQNSVKKIAQDDAGFIWLGTDAGLSRFDGQNFKNFDEFNFIRGIHSFEPDLSPSPSHIYAVTDRYDRVRINGGKAERIRDGEELNEALIKNSLLPKPKNYLTRGLPEPVAGSVYPEQLLIPFSGPRTYICSTDQVQYMDGHQVVASYNFQSDDLWHFFRINDKLYHISDSGQLSIMDPEKSRSLVQSSHIENLPNFKTANTIIYWSNATNQAFIWVDKTLFGLIQDNNGSLKAKKLFTGFDFRSRQIQSIFYDQNHQTLFLGSLTEGLFVIKKKGFTTLTNPNLHADNVYYAQALLNPSTIITPQGYLFDLKPDQTYHIQENKELGDHYNTDKYSMVRDSLGNFWVKSFTKLYKYDSTATKIIAQRKFVDGMTWLYPGKNNRLWIGFRLSGLYYMDIHSQDLKPKKLIGAPFTNITWIQETEGEALWVGTDKGLYKVDLRNKNTVRIKQLSAFFIRSIYSPQPNEMWITTYQNGIYLIKDNKITKLPIDQNRFLARSHCMVEDSSGFMWVNTNNGLFQFKKQALLDYAANKTIPYYRHYNKSNGFNINEFNGGCQPCALQWSNGQISFPSMNGLVIFNPNQFQSIQKPTPIVIDELLVGKRVVKPTGDTLTLDHDHEQIKLYTSNAYLGDPNNFKLYYSLRSAGTTPEWYRLESADYSITLSQLNPGNYTLIIRAIGGFDKESVVTKHLTIQIKKPWFQSWWAIGMLLLSTLGLIILFFNLRLRYALKQNELLEGKIRERTLTLQKTVLDLKDSQSELLKQNKLHTYIIASISHDFRSPLKFIQAWMTQIPKTLDNGQTDSLRSSSLIAEKTLRNMMRFTEDMTHYLKAITSEAHSGWSPVLLKPLIENKTTLFKSITWSNKGTIEIDIDPTIQIQTNANLLGIVIHNLIDNAFKAKPNGLVHIYANWSTKFSKPILELTVQDNGPGMPEDLLLWLNSPTKDNISPPKNYQGLGLAMVKSACETLGVSLRYHNHHGTEVTLTFD